MYLWQLLKSFPQKVGAVIDNHVAELQMHMLPITGSCSRRAGLASGQCPPALPALQLWLMTSIQNLKLWHYISDRLQQLVLLTYCDSLTYCA